MVDVLEILKPYLSELLSAVVAVAVLWLRARVQMSAAVQAAEVQERLNIARVEQGSTNSVTSGSEKHAAVLEEMTAWHPAIRPLTESGANKLIQKAVPVAKVRAAE